MKDIKEDLTTYLKRKEINNNETISNIENLLINLALVKNEKKKKKHIEALAGDIENLLFSLQYFDFEKQEIEQIINKLGGSEDIAKSAKTLYNK